MSEIAKRVFSILTRHLEAAKTVYMIKRNSKLVHGQAKISLLDEQCAIVSLMKDAEYFVETFLRHHFALGVSHVVIIDNGSTDRTVAIARNFENVTVIENHLPAKAYESSLRAQIAQRVINGGWLLFVDSDELFEVPLDASLPRLIAYLEAHRYTAMVTQMLDMFSIAPNMETRSLSYADTLTAFRFYSLNEITAVEYHDQTQVKFNWFLRENICEDQNIKLMIGGMRREIFGEDCFLSKHSLVRNGAARNPMPHPHCASGVRIADVSGLLRHFKFAGNYQGRDQKSVSESTWCHNEDHRRLAHHQGDPEFSINCATVLEYKGPQALAEQGFLWASDRYRSFIATDSRSKHL